MLLMEINSNDAQHIVGSAEPLTPEETQKRLQELETWGVDLTLVRASLNRTPTERVDRMVDLLKLAREMRSSYISRASQREH
ncbi:MAG: hypothetical protein NVS4B11_04140 [Ktedonobacteraceae bacterium]